ncbi:uncharacterized protein [Typha angustifolia]|uniref:uncharacterized protein n=1 Tax=Typha angustifolia TaxID=59011 RepID=UPI003C30B981
MVKSDAAVVVYDRSSSFGNGSRRRKFENERDNFMSSNLVDMYCKPISTEFVGQSDVENEDMDIRKLLKDIEYLGASNMTWKERKQLENQNIVSFGGKPPKKHRTPLSVSKVAMKNQKKREQKKLEEDMILGRFGNRGAKKTKEQKTKPEDRALKATEGHFRKGVLNVKHLMSSKPSNSDDGPQKKMRKGKGKKKGGRKGR